MRLFDAIIDANHRALDGDKGAGLHLADYAAELPVVAMTCIDPRLNRLFPGVMGLPAESFIWLRNAGNIITGPLSSMTRSLSLACAVKGGREIAIIGHSDCQVARTSLSELVERYRAIGIERHQLPANLTEYFGVFTNERENVKQSVALVRSSPLISRTVPVQGLLVDIVTGRLEWVVNGYDVLEKMPAGEAGLNLPQIGGALTDLGGKIGEVSSELKVSEVKIGELATEVKQDLKEAVEEVKLKIAPALAPTPQRKPGTPPPIPTSARNIPVPPPIRMNRGSSGR